MSRLQFEIVNATIQSMRSLNQTTPKIITDLDEKEKLAQIHNNKSVDSQKYTSWFHLGSAIGTLGLIIIGGLATSCFNRKDIGESLLFASKITPVGMEFFTARAKGHTQDQDFLTRINETAQQRISEQKRTLTSQIDQLAENCSRASQKEV